MHGGVDGGRPLVYPCHMSMVHSLAASSHVSFVIPPWVSLPVLGGGLVLVHLIRARRADDQLAHRWLSERHLEQDTRSVDTALQYLRRLRWSRVVATLFLVAVCGVVAALSSGWVSFVSLPFLLSVLGAETLAPNPRRGRVRTASLERRSRSYFAPRLALAAARATILVATVLSVAGIWAATSWAPGMAVMHGLVLLLGGVALELSLHAVSARALPDRNPDLALDTAMRVASARAATAAALVFGTFGLFLAVGLAGVAPPRNSAVAMAVSQVVNFGLLAAIGVAVALTRPLGSWTAGPKQ